MTIIYDIKQQVSYLPVDEDIIEGGMTMKHFRRLTFLLSFIFILTVGGVAAMAANNGRVRMRSGALHMLSSTIRIITKRYMCTASGLRRQEQLPVPKVRCMTRVRTL